MVQTTAKNPYSRNSGIDIAAVSKTIRNIWSPLLKMEQVPMDGNFILMGGDSLAVVIMLEQVFDNFGVVVTIEEFLEDPTTAGTIAVIVEKLAEQAITQHPNQDQGSSEQAGKANLKSPGKFKTTKDDAQNRYIAAQILPGVRRRSGSNSKCLVQLREGGSESPLFLVHPAGGTTQCYFPLVRSLPDNFPVYGLQSPNLRPEANILTTVEDMCEIYVKEITDVQPEGPYRIAGWSAGGVFTLEIAQQLVRMGHEIEHAGIIDTPFNFPILASKVSGNRMLCAVLENIRKSGSKNLFSGFKYAKRTGNIALRRYADKGYDDPETREKQFEAVIEKYQGKKKRPVMANQIISLAVRNYRPQIYPGRLTYYRSEVLRKTLQNLGPWDLNWSLIAEQGVETVELPGNHASIIFPPWVNQLGQAMGHALD